MVHRKDDGRTSLTNLKDYSWWHYHVVLHQLGWTLTAHPDGTSQVRSPAGQTIHSHSPPAPTRVTHPPGKSPAVLSAGEDSGRLLDRSSPQADESTCLRSW